MRKTDIERSSSLFHRSVLGLICACSFSIAYSANCMASGLTMFQPAPPRLSLEEQAHAPSGMLQLCQYDVVLVIDKSRSMSVIDCPKAVEQAKSDASQSSRVSPESLVSRWEWCREQILGLVETPHAKIPLALKVVLFSDGNVAYENIDPPGIQLLFSQNSPSGPTHATVALSSQFEEYFARRSSMGEKAKPVLIAMITDGCPENPTSVCCAIAAATLKMNRSDEIAVTILQIGRDQRATKFIEQLNGMLISKRSRFNIVTTKSFEELQTTGLVRALVDAITVKHQVTQANAPKYGLAQPSGDRHGTNL